MHFWTKDVFSIFTRLGRTKDSLSHTKVLATHCSQDALMLTPNLALLETSVEAKIPQAYRDLLEKWNGDDAIDGLIRNGKYLGENGEEVERPSKPSATQTTPIMQICKKYEEVFTRFCASSNPEAIKVLTEDFNTMLKAQWSATPETERLEPPNWNIVSERLEVAKAVNEKRKNTSQHDPEYGSFYSAVEIEKARFTKEARDYGFGDAYCEIYNKAIEDCTNTDPSLVGSIDKITAQADPTKDVEMGEAPDAGAIGEIEPRIKAYNKETEGWHNIIAWRPWGKGNQVVLEMTAEGAKTPVCHLHPSGPNKGAFETFKESKGLNMSDHKGTQQDLKGHKFDAFKWVSIIYKHRTTTEPQLGWAKEAAMFAQGSIGGQEPFKFYSKYEMGKEWGRDFMLGEFATRINSAQLPAPKPPSRNLLAATGRKALENQPYHAGLPTMERQQTQSLLTNIATQAAKVQPQLGALGDTTQQLRFPMQNNQLPMQNNQLPMQNNQLPVAQTQVQLDELVKPMEKMSLEALWRELQFYRSQAELANVVQPTIMQPALMQA